MSHGVNSNEELAVAALLNFGSNNGSAATADGGGTPSSSSSSNKKDTHDNGGGKINNGRKEDFAAVSSTPLNNDPDASAVQDSSDAKSAAVVTEGEPSSSSDMSSKESSKAITTDKNKRPSEDPNVANNKRARTEVSTESSSSSNNITSPAILPRTDPNNKDIYIIQDCHAVLGDRHCAGRTTIATVILREIKLEYKDKYKGKGVDKWYDEAMTEYYKRVKERVPGFTQDDYETVLVYSYAPKGRKKDLKAAAVDAAVDAEIGSNRVEKPNCYKYACDDIPKYGKANVHEAVTFFFNSKDAPTLPKEISKYRSDFNKLRMSTDQPAAEKVKFFEDFLKFCEENLQKSKEGEEMAKQLLRSLNLIPTLRRLWETLKDSGSKASSKKGKGKETATQKNVKASKHVPTTTDNLQEAPQVSDSQMSPSSLTTPSSGGSGSEVQQVHQV